MNRRTAFLAGAILAAFGASLGLPFIFDDVPIIRDNPGLENFASLRQLAGPLYYGEFGVGNYHPLPLFAFFCLRKIFGAVAWPFHALSLLVHIANAMLVLLLSNRLMEKIEGRGRWVLGATLLWAVSPLHSQTVFVGAFLPDLSCAFFSLTALVFFLERRQGVSMDRRVGLAFALALFCKETAVVLPLILIIAGFWNGAAPSARGLRPYFYIIAAYAVFRLTAVNDMEMIASTPVLPPEAGMIPFLRFLSALQWMVWPFPLSLIHDTPGFNYLREPRLWFSLAALTAAALLNVRAGRSRLAIFSAAWIFLWLVPFLNLLPLGYARGYFAGQFLNERYLYAASLGFFWLAASALESLKSRRWIFSACAAAAAAVFIAADWRQAWISRDEIRLWSEVVLTSPRSLYARNILGVAHLYRNQAESGKLQFEAALALGRGSAWERSMTYANLGASLEMLSRREEARSAYRMALKLYPLNAEARRHFRRN